MIDLLHNSVAAELEDLSGMFCLSISHLCADTGQMTQKNELEPLWRMHMLVDLKNGALATLWISPWGVDKSRLTYYLTWVYI